MSDQSKAQHQLEKFLPETTVKAWTKFGDLYLFRVEYPSLLEKDWDPFFSVDPLTGEVRDFSVLTDISSEDFFNLEWNQL